MARSRSIDYRVGFSGDTSQLEAAIKKATESLTKLGTSPDALRRGLEGASRSALELSQHLNTAFNQDTGKLDLIKFQQSLKASGKSIQDYATSLRSLGPQGEQAFLEVASAIGKAELPLKRTNNLIKQFGVTLWNTARWRITTGAINSIVGGMQQAMGYAKSLDSSLNNIRIVTGKSAEEMAAFAKEANSAAKALSTTTTTYTDASLIYYQQGLDTEAVKQRTEATIKMANVTGQSAETISSQMTAIWENFDDGSRSLESFGDAMVALGASTAASSKEIAEGLQKFAPIAQTVGLSFDYASAALTTIVANTRESANVAGTALKTLFSRLEGLKLGETLEDGTDLNKYSSALMAVGINIKDVSGNLKDMDSILDELGAKWQSLAKDQQLALAETVGGVRQYAQLVALMDNWADFQKNLITAQSSEGALQRQADIYAESWEAARKRIKAATEDIYDSLINADQFVKLDDMFTPILTGVASAVDALGGLTGMLPLVVLLMNKAFGDKIAQSLRDMTVNIGLMTGAEQKRARALQDTVAETAKSLSIGYEENAVVDARVSILQEEVALQAQINSNIDQMPAAQQDVLNNELKIVDAYKQQAVASAELLETRKEIAENARIDIWSGASNSKGITTIEQLFGNKYQSIQNNQFIDTKSIDVVNDLDNAIASLTSQLEKAVGTSAKISHLNKALSNTKTATEEAKNEAIKLLEVYGNAPGANASVEQIRVKLKQLSNEASTARTALRTALQNLDVDPHSINVFIGAVTKLTEAGYDSEAAIEAVRRAMEKAGQTAQASSAAFFDWADALVKIGTYASKTAMAVRAIGNLKEIFSKDNDLSFSEKFTQGAMSVSMIAPLISSGIKGLQNFKQDSNINFSNLADEVEKSKLAFDAATESLKENQQAISDLKQKIGNLPKGTNPKKLQEDLETLKTSTQGLKDAAKQTGEEYAKLAESAKLASVASKDAALAAGVAAAAVTAIAVAVALAIKYINDYKEKVKQLNKEKMETADKAKEEISNNQSLIDSYRQLLNTYRETGEGKDQLDAKAKELAEAYNVEGASLASLTENYEEFLDTINQLNRDQLTLQQGTFLEAANAAVNYNGKKVTFGDDAAEALQKAGLYQYTKPGSFGLTLDLQISTSSYDELLELQKKLEAVKNDSIIGKGATQALQEINAELAKAQDYLSQAAVIEVELKAPDGSDISSFEGFKDWQERALGLLKSNSNFDVQLLDTATIIKQAALDLGLDKWVQIQNVTEDIEASLEKYPDYLSKAKTKFGEIASLDDAKVFEYLPWSQINDNNFDEVYEQTKAYIKAQEIGAQTALKYADAEKLLQKIQSGSKLNAKDLKDYANLFEGGQDEFIDFLTNLSPDEQEAKLNRIIQNSFAQQQKDRTARIAEIGNEKEGLLGASYTARDTARESLAKAGFDSEESLEAVIGTVTKLQDQWDLTTVAVKNYYAALEQARTEGKEEEFLNDPRHVNPLDAYGLSADNLEQALDEVNELFKKKLAENPYTERVNQYQQAIQEIIRLTQEKDSITETQKLEAANYESETNLLVGQIKTLGDLNKLQKTRNLTTDQYAKGILNLAKTMPSAAKALKNYNDLVKSGTASETELADAMRDVADIVDADAWGQAIGKMKDANKELEAAGMKLGNAEKAIDPEKYQKKLGEIADAIREVTGATEDQINESWVENHAQQVQDILNGDVETVNAAVGSIRLALYASSQDFANYAQNIGVNANNIQSLVSALDGIEFDINGYADMSQVINNLLAAGATATQIAQLLQYIGNAQVGFEVSGVPSKEDFIYEDPYLGSTEFDEAGYLAALQNFNGAKLKATTNLGNIPNYGGGSSGGGGSSKKDTKDLKKDLKDIEERYHEINRQLERQSRILTELEKQINRTYGTDRLKLYKQQLKEIEKNIELLTRKSEEANDYLKQDKAVLEGLVVDPDLDVKLFEGIDVQFGVGQEIENYKAVLQQIVDLYNAFIAEYEAAIAAGDQALIEELEKRKEIEDKLYQARLDALKKYEDSLDNVNTLAHQIADERRKEEDIKLQEITYKMKLVIDIRDARKAINDFSREIEESFGDALTHGIKAAFFDEQNAREEIAMYQHYVDEYEALKQRLAEANEYTDTDAIVEELKNLESNIIESGEALLEWLEKVENMYVEALEAAAARFEHFTNQLSHNTEVLGTIKELYQLQGVTYKTEEGFNRLQNASQGQYQGYLRQAELNKKWYDETSARLAEAEEKLAGVSETDVQYDALKKNRDALLEEANKAQKAMLENSKAAMEMAKQMYLDQIQRMSYEVEQKLTNGMGFDLMQDKYDHMMEESDRYLDTVEESLETSLWYAKLEGDIEKTTNKAYQQRLRALEEEIELRRENNTLSQYDLDILEAKYEVLKAQAELEDQQNNKTKLRLVRDSNGNWNYQYTANLGDIEQKEQDLLKAKQNEYEITKKQVQDLEAELIKLPQEAAKAVEQVYRDMAEGILSEDEGQARLEELERYYTTKANYLQNELERARADMSEAALTSEILAAGLTESVYNTSSDLIRDLVDVFKREGGEQLLTVASTTFGNLTQALIPHLEAFKNSTDEVKKQLLGILTAENSSDGKSFKELYDALSGEEKEHLIDALNSWGEPFNLVSGEIGSLINGIIHGDENSLDKLHEAIGNTGTDLWGLLIDNSDSILKAADGLSGGFARDISHMIDNITQEFVPTITEWIPKMGDAFDDFRRKIEETADAIGVDPDSLDDMVQEVTDDIEDLYDSGDQAIDMMLRQLDAIEELQDAYLVWAEEIMDVIRLLEELARKQVVPTIEDVGGGGDDEDEDEPDIPEPEPDIPEPEPEPEPEPSGWPPQAGDLVSWTGNAPNRVFTVNGKSYPWGTPEADLLQQRLNQRYAEGAIDWLNQTFRYNTGGYTGTWNGSDGRLALLHQKELVLNADDTEKILEAVHIMRGISDTVFRGIADQLDSAGAASMALLGSRLGSIEAPSASSSLEQHITIEQVNFPGVTSSREIEEAFESLVNDAAQWARRRKS